jgi:hypothetical protein
MGLSWEMEAVEDFRCTFTIWKPARSLRESSALRDCICRMSGTFLALYASRLRPLAVLVMLAGRMRYFTPAHTGSAGESV